MKSLFSVLLGILLLLSLLCAANAGQVVGNYWQYDSLSGAYTHGYLKDGATFTSFDYPGATYTYANGINNSGRIVGYYSIAGQGVFHGFLKDGATFTSFDYLGASWTQANGINNAGQIVGTYFGGPYHHGFVKDGATLTSFDYPGADDTYATGINSAGQIVGYYTSGGQGVFHGYLKDGATFTSFDYPGASWTQANGINSVPIPPSLSLLAPGLVGLAAIRRRLKK